MQSTDLPAVDDHVVEPETGTEMIDGKVRQALPAEPPHADEQCQIAYVIRPDVAPGYVASTELLTRVQDEQDFATDACIRKRGRNPVTGARYLEEVSFEVKHKQSNSDLKKRARMLTERGVRRVFAIHVREDRNGIIRAGPVKEWIPDHDDWLPLHPERTIEDPCLVQPIKVQALLDATEADNQVARVLLAKNNPVITAAMDAAVDAREKALSQAHDREIQAREKALSQAHQREMQALETVLIDAHQRAVHELSQAHEQEIQARDEQLRKMIRRLCGVLAITITAERRARMDGMTGDELDSLCSAISEQRRWPEKL